MFRQRKSQHQAKEEKTEFQNPLEELTYLLDTLEGSVEKSLDRYVMTIQPPPVESRKRTSLVDSLKKLRRKTDTELDSSSTKGASEDLNSTDKSSSLEASTTRESSMAPNDVDCPPIDEAPATPANLRFPTILGPKQVEAKFLPMDSDEVARMVEVIRRVAELVVIGERAAASAIQHKEKLQKLAEKQQWGGEIMEEEDELFEVKARNAESDKYIAIFEAFFERNGLALITNILTGVSFDLRAYREKQRSNLHLDRSGHVEDLRIAEDMLQGIDLDEHSYMLLPPLPVATQAIQSVSILVQNVSRATSLFFILSNNHVNQLINFPLEEYHIAERKKHKQEANGMSPRRFGSPELAELTTHFITFLKSLALRMNSETLQFFLTYPSDTTFEAEEASTDASHFSDNNPQDMDEIDDDRPMDEVQSNFRAAPKKALRNRPVLVKKVKIEFPLYERALEFCSAHQDSFVRVTAMNICLNTLRLATVSPEQGYDEIMDLGLRENTGSSPDGVLYNAKPLPMRERLAIAQYVCSPSRVERLASPIFTKLAQLWGMLEEQFRDMDTAPETRYSDIKSGRKSAASEKVARAKETARRQKITDSFNDIAYKVQDELLLLEDVLKVGLTSLNEQTIEMMFATFVYPLLLQPLLLYFQRSPVPDEVLFADPLNDHSAGRDIKDSDSSASERLFISAPAKSALFSLASVFQLVSNAPLRRLLFTALFHPLSPDTTGETMIRAMADVACFSSNGEVAIRVDGTEKKTLGRAATDRATYVFGTVTGKKCRSGSSEYSGDEGETCVFVLSPALAEVLEFRGDDAMVVARTRANPYRKAIFKCLTLCSQLSDLRPLSVLAVDAAVSVVDERLVSDIMFGLDLKKFEDNMPADERSSGAHHIDFDDRGIGGSAPVESRLGLGAGTSSKFGHDHLGEVILAFRSCVMKAVPGGNGEWKLEYDLVVAHSLLCVIRGNGKALRVAAKGIDGRCRQAAAFLADSPLFIEKVGGERLRNHFPNLAGNNDGRRYATMMDIIVRGYGATSDLPCLLNDLVKPKTIHCVDEKPDHSISVSGQGSYNVLCSRCCAFPSMGGDPGEIAIKNAIGSARAWGKLDALSTMLNSLVPSDGRTVRQRDIGGFLVKTDGSLVATNDPHTVYAPLSEHFWNALFEEDRDETFVEARPGTVVSLVGHTAFPCVCEVPPSSAPLFSEAGAKVVSQGITWQSLYLVILGRNFVLAEPERRSSGDGRVVTSCKLERLVIEKDHENARSDTSARRLIVSHDGPDFNPPGLFLFESTPTLQDEGPFIRQRLRRSSLDVWFEDNRAVQIAFNKVSRKVAEARAYRGHRIQKYLTQGVGSGYPVDIPLYKPQPEDTI